MIALSAGLVTCINGGVRDVDIDSFGGTVEISTPGFFEDNLCYQSDMDCRWQRSHDNL